MTILSKLFQRSCREWTCYELGHTWTPSCFDAWTLTGLVAFREGFKIYLPLYVVAAILRGRGAKYYLTEMLPEVLRSSTFLGANAFFFLGAFCMWRWLFGEPVLIMMFLTSLVGGLAAITLERSQRRQLLAVYMANIAVETLYLMLKGRGLVRPLPYGEVWIFCSVVSTLMYLFRRGLLHGSTRAAVEFFAGKVRKAPTDVSKSPAPSASSRWRCFEALGLLSRLRGFLSSLRQMARHRLCQHANSCLYNAIEGGTRLFSYGYILQTVLRAARSLALITRRPLQFLKRSLFHKAGLKFGSFLGSLVLLLRGLRCLLIWLRNKDPDWHSALVGFLSGWSMLFFRSATLAMYAASKTVEIVVLRGVETGVVPSLPGGYGYILLYSVSMAFVFHAGILEPHNVRPAYYNFLKKICGDRFQQMNRRLLDEFGTHASKLDPDFWPAYDPRYTPLAQGPHVIAELARQRRLGLA